LGDVPELQLGNVGLKTAVEVIFERHDWGLLRGSNKFKKDVPEAAGPMKISCHDFFEKSLRQRFHNFLYLNNQFLFKKGGLTTYYILFQLLKRSFKWA
jgi:hypothetical protein